MDKPDQTRRVARILVKLRADIEELRCEGACAPAVEKNAVRLSGTLRTLEIQFGDLVSAVGKD